MRNHLHVQRGPYLTPLLSQRSCKLPYCHVRHDSVLFALCFANTAVVSGFPSETRAKVRTDSQALSEFDCCFLVLRYHCFLKANFNVQFDDQVGFYNVTV